MADTVSSQTIADGDRIAVMKFTNLSDGTGESAVLKVDVSELASNSKTGWAVERVKICRMWYSTSGMTVDVLWDANVDQVAWVVSGDGYIDFRSFGPIAYDDDAATGYTGDIKFTTTGHSSGDRYAIILEMEKSFALPVLS